MNVDGKLLRPRRTKLSVALRNSDIADGHPQTYYSSNLQARLHSGFSPNHTRAWTPNVFSSPIQSSERPISLRFAYFAPILPTARLFLRSNSAFRYFGYTYNTIPVCLNQSEVVLEGRGFRPIFSVMTIEKTSTKIDSPLPYSTLLCLGTGAASRLYQSQPS